jgi:hypothetical protein
MKTVRYSAGGGRVTAAVKVSPKRDGSYEMRLWEKETNELVEPFPCRGNFINNDDDDWPLPRPNGENDGRALEVLVALSMPPDVMPCNVSLVLTQDGEEIGRDGKDVPEGVEDHQLSLWVQLRKGA